MILWFIISISVAALLQVVGAHFFFSSFVALTRATNVNGSLIMYGALPSGDKWSAFVSCAMRQTNINRLHEYYFRVKQPELIRAAVRNHNDSEFPFGHIRIQSTEPFFFLCLLHKFKSRAPILLLSFGTRERWRITSFFFFSQHRNICHPDHLHSTQNIKHLPFVPAAKNIRHGKERKNTPPFIEVIHCDYTLRYIQFRCNSFVPAKMHRVHCIRLALMV